MLKGLLKVELFVGRWRRLAVSLEVPVLEPLYRSAMTPPVL